MKTELQVVCTEFRKNKRIKVEYTKLRPDEKKDEGNEEEISTNRI